MDNTTNLPEPIKAAISELGAANQYFGNADTMALKDRWIERLARCQNAEKALLQVVHDTISQLTSALKDLIEVYDSPYILEIVSDPMSDWLHREKTAVENAKRLIKENSNEQ